MVTKLESPLKRELSIDGRPYVLTITPDGLLLTEKGRRKGYEMAWSAFVSGETALATALNASIAGAPPPRNAAGAKTADAPPASPSAAKRKRGASAR